MSDSVFDFDPMPVIRLTEELLNALPQQSLLACELERAMTGWLHSVEDAYDILNGGDNECSQRVRRARQAYLLKDAQASAPLRHDTPPPHAAPERAVQAPISSEKIAQREPIETAPEEEPISSKKTARSASPKTPDDRTDLPRLWENIVGKSAAMPSRNRINMADLMGWYCWKLATCQNEDALKEYQRHWTLTPPSDAPHDHDIILHGTYIESETCLPIWIGPVSEIALFTEEYVPKIDPHAHIWLSFSETRNEMRLEQPRWIAEHPEALPFWRFWHELCFWAALTPEATVFVNNKCEQLSQSRVAICQTLSRIHRNFEDALEHPEHGEIGKHLHYAYAVFHQFLLPEDIDPKNPPTHVFACLRNAIRNALERCRKSLEIEEEHPAGPLREKEFYSNPNIQGMTDKPIRISKKDAFVEGLKNEGDNRIAYWLRPKWKLLHPKETQRADLLGSVLYLFD